jgi:putative membrane protein
MNNQQIPERNEALYTKLKQASYIVAGIVLILVGLMRRVKYDLGIDFSILPMVNAICNTIVAACLLIALYHIKTKNWVAHRNYIYTAMVFSALFLLTYVLYHFTTVETKFCHEGSIKTVYYILLISHIVLAGVSLPFILLTFSKGQSFLVPEHRKMAKWVYPIWLYVAISGPICYLMLKDCY